MNFFLAAGSLGNWLDTTFAGFDMSVFRFFGSLQSDFLTGIAKVFTAMGESRYVVMFAVFGLILCLFRRTRKYGLSFIFAIVIGTLLTNIIIKPVFLRIRPYNTLQQIAEYFGWYRGAGMMAESDYSFPSGHTTAAMEIAVSLFLCFRKDKKGRWAWLFLLVALLVGCSRVYLMVHYATDIIAGIAIGLIAGIVGYNLSRILLRRFDNSRIGKKIDLERVFYEKWHFRMEKVVRISAVIVIWLAIFLVSVLHVAKAGGDSLRCAYDGDYKCYNEAQTGSKYPPIDGEYYCKIHWKELNP